MFVYYHISRVFNCYTFYLQGLKYSICWQEHFFRSPPFETKSTFMFNVGSIELNNIIFWLNYLKHIFYMRNICYNHIMNMKFLKEKIISNHSSLTIAKYILKSAKMEEGNHRDWKVATNYKGKNNFLFIHSRKLIWLFMRCTLKKPKRIV